jgi:hypothetical protein
VAQLRGSDWGPDSAPDSAIVSAVHACSDKYVEVTVSLPGGKSARGWSWTPGSNQLTTCDGSSVSEPK